ncbi:MAG: SAM-dependent chlorinase/fluorinase, partial [bacterium]|nr:SAM-dependent chlorinase/fluorinase [bacterium]
MARPIITLTTDFGLDDHFAGTMKGVILGILPTAEIVDLCHNVTPFEITEGAFLIAQAYRYFPKRTVHVVVVDPGVGTARRPILVEAAGQFFIGPDNGVLSMVYSREKHKARHITARKYFLEHISNTFHGRDVFAPVAAHLRKGTPPSKFGKLIGDHLRPTFEKPVRTGKRYWTGAVLKVDHFGNLITNFRLDEFPELRLRPF